MDAALSRITGHGAQVFVDQWLAADKKQVADVILDADINDIACLLEGHAAALLWVEAVHSEAAEIAFGVADIRDGKLEVAWAAMVEHVSNQLKSAGFGPRNGTREIRRRRRRFRRRSASIQSSGCGAHGPGHFASESGPGQMDT